MEYGFPHSIEKLLRLAGIAVVVALVLGLLLAFIRPAVDPTPPSPSALQPVRVQTMGQASPGQGEAIVDRPLFWQSRRPYLSAEAEIEDQPATDSGALRDIVLAGIFASGPNAGVILDDKGERYRLTVGQELMGWELVSLTPSSATFIGRQRRNGPEMEKTLELQYRNPQSGKAAGASQAHTSGERDPEPLEPGDDKLKNENPERNANE